MSRAQRFVWYEVMQVWEMNAYVHANRLVGAAATIGVGNGSQNKVRAMQRIVQLVK